MLLRAIDRMPKKEGEVEQVCMIARTGEETDRCWLTLQHATRCSELVLKGLVADDGMP